jgi:hypothetical protein
MVGFAARFGRDRQRRELGEPNDELAAADIVSLS